MTLRDLARQEARQCKAKPRRNILEVRFCAMQSTKVCSEKSQSDRHGFQIPHTMGLEQEYRRDSLLAHVYLEPPYR
jgi:hypothetical protein